MDNDIELEIGRAAAPGHYVVHVVRSPAGGDEREEFELDVEGLLRNRSSLEAGILSTAVGARRVTAPAEQPIREVGQQLFEALFRRSVYGAYRASLGVAQQHGDRLRVVLRFSAPELAALPWEMLFDPERDTYVCRQEPMVRRVPAQFNPQAALEVEPPLRVLAMVASPRGLPLLDVEREHANLDAALRELVIAGLVEVSWVEQASWRSVHAKLLSGHWHVVHFIGHGDYDEAREEGILAFVGRDGRPDLVDATRFADLLGEADPTPRLVVLNACSSGEGSGNDLLSATAPALVHSGIEAVAAMQFAVSDDAAVAFAEGFYTAIAQSRAVDEAARSGRIAMLGSAGSLEWITPVLYVRGDSTRPIVMRPPSRTIPHPREPGAEQTAEPSAVPEADATTEPRAEPRAELTAEPTGDRGRREEALEPEAHAETVPPTEGTPAAWWRSPARRRWVLAGAGTLVVLAVAGALVLRPHGQASLPPRLSDATVFSPVRDPSNSFTRIDVLDTSTGKRSPWAGDADRLNGPTPPYVDRFSATPSPDRTKVAYLVQSHMQPPRPYLADPSGRHAHLLMSAANAPCDRTKRPAWNADGTKMAVVCVLPDDQWSLWIVSATDGARVTQVVANTTANLGSPSWDTAHHRIYMWTGPPPDHGLGTRGTPVWVPDDSAQPVTPKPVAGTRGDTYTDPDWASPGLLMVRDLPSGNRIVVVDDGRPQIVAKGPYQYAAWSPDHRRIVAVKGQNGPNARMVVFDYPDGTSRTVGGPAWLGTPVWGTR